MTLTRRRSSFGASSSPTSGWPQARQNRAMAGFSWPQAVQRLTAGSCVVLPAVFKRGRLAALYRVCGKPRSTFDVAGSGQRDVTTLPRV